MQSKTPFDTKAAASELPKYDGRDKQVIWRKKVTNYLHGRCSDMADLLQYAEKCTAPITQASLAAACRL